jgi:hypothetical protein
MSDAAVVMGLPGCVSLVWVENTFPPAVAFSIAGRMGEGTP